jgi:SAM-dependent methyltransferase
VTEASERAELNRAAFLSASFLSLFLEVLLIRWCGAEIRILAYLRNLTLLGCFLGLGLGYAAHKRTRLGLGFSFGAVALLVGLAPTFKNLSSLLNFADMNSWLKGSSDALRFALGLALLSFLYALLAFAFVPLGQSLGAHFAAISPEKRIREYTWNVLASLAGVLAFGLLSWFEAPPLAWFLVALAAALVAARTYTERASVLVLGGASVLLLVLGEKIPPDPKSDRTILEGARLEVVETRWSPYQKIQLVRDHDEFERPVQVKEGPERLAWDDYSAYVNGHWYSRVGTTDLGIAKQRADYSGSPMPYEFEYSRQIPYWVAPAHENVLLLGAGMGRDAATALAQGAKEVDVVEIERRFVEWGKEHHPAHPYDDTGRVHVHVDDARRFLKAAPAGSYDLVIFCYLDSHGLTSNFTNTNLDSYVYTEESLEDARRVLRPNGVCAIGFSSVRPFIYARLQALMEKVWKTPPVRSGEDLFLASNEEPRAFRARAASKLGANLRPLEVLGGGAKPPLTTDDWPFFYLESASVPMVFRAVLLAIAATSALGVRLGVGPSAGARCPGPSKRARRIDLHFLLLGAAFMLVETWAISRASLVYGATWYVSSAVIASLLVAVLLANTVVERQGPVRLTSTFSALLLGLVAATLLDPARLLDLPRAAQLLLAAPLYAVPFLFASLIFASSFRRAEDPSAALASNLLGSVLGGAFECLSFATGLRSLGFVAIALYALAWVAARRRV